MPFLRISHAGGERVLALAADPLRVGPADSHLPLEGVAAFEVRGDSKGWSVVALDPSIPLRAGMVALEGPQRLREGDTIRAGRASLAFVADSVLDVAGEVSEAARRGAESVTALYAEQEPEALVPRVIDTALAATGAQRGFLLLAAQRGFQVAASRGFDAQNTSDEELQLSHTIAQRVYRSGHPIHTADASKDHRFLEADSVQAHGIGSVICTPLTIEGEPFGVLYLDRPPGSSPFSGEAVALAVPLANAAGQALWRSNRYRRACEALWESERGLKRLRTELSRRFGKGRFVGTSPAIMQLLQLVGRVAAADAPVLVWGESGTGKELVARMIHAVSSRAEGPFEAVACSALPAELLETELFGHTKGAFTGADEERPGLFARADGGTVLLDDLSATSEAMQAKLLRVLQEGAVRPLGSPTPQTVNFRVISTLSEDPEQALRSGTLREDLFHRLSTLPVRVPSLRERRGDITLLAGQFLEEVAKGKRFTPQTLALLEGYPWPGNVRELRNEVVRASVLGDAELRPEHLSPRLRGEKEPRQELDLSEVRPLDEVEREAITNAMRVFGGNRVKVAQALGIARSTLYKRLDKYGIT